MAQLSSNIQIPSSGSIHQPIIFDKIETNVGTAYNSFTGVFTAPYNAVYHFNLELAIPNGVAGQVLHVIIEKNGEKSGYTFFVVEPHRWLRRTTAVTLNLVHGDAVQVVVVLSTGNQDNVIGGDRFHSHFSGFLVGHV